jgi:hypothetical protein
MAIFYVTALRSSPQKHEDRARPKVIALDTTGVTNIVTDINSSGYERTIIKYQKNRSYKNVTAAEKLGEYWVQIDFNNAASSPYNTGTKANVAASGAGAASGTAITAYHNSITAATASTMTGVRLPSASGTRTGTAMVVLNKTSVSCIVYPAASESLNSSTAGAVTVGPNQFTHFYASATNAWVSCKGPYNS